MTAKQAKEKTDEAYFKIQEEKINIKIDSTNEWIEKQSLKGSYSIDIDIEALDFHSYLKIRKYYKELGYKVSFPHQRGLSGYYVRIRWY